MIVGRLRDVALHVAVGFDEQVRIAQPVLVGPLADETRCFRPLDVLVDDVEDGDLRSVNVPERLGDFSAQIRVRAASGR